MKQVYLTLVAIVRDQEHYIKEWLAFHHLVGVERFVIVLHHCRDATEQKIRELPFADAICVHHVGGNETRAAQMGAYHWAVREYGRCTEWILFLDSDEFFFGTHEDSLPTILNRYEHHGGLAAHWHHFGHGGNVVRPTGLSLEYYLKRKKTDFYHNRGVKSAVRTSQLLALLSPHLQLTMAPIVTENHRPVGDTFYSVNDREPHWNVVRCNHYYVRSMEDWVERYRRGSCNTFHGRTDVYSVERFLERGAGEVHDETILRFVQKIKEVLNDER